MSTAINTARGGRGLKRRLAILLFAAGGFVTEIVRPVYCSCIAESSWRMPRKEQRTDV